MYQTWSGGAGAADEAVHGTLRGLGVPDHPLHLHAMREGCLIFGAARSTALQEAAELVLTPAVFVTSAEQVLMRAAAPPCAASICAFAASNFCCDRATSVTWAPCCTSTSAVARPMPVDPPVMSTCLPAKLRGQRSHPIQARETAAKVKANGSSSRIISSQKKVPSLSSDRASDNLSMRCTELLMCHQQHVATTSTIQYDAEVQHISRRHSGWQPILQARQSMITALANFSGCHAGSLAKWHDRCCPETRMQVSPRLCSQQSLNSRSRSQRSIPCRAQAGAAVTVLAPRMAVRLRHAACLLCRSTSVLMTQEIASLRT